MCRGINEHSSGVANVLELGGGSMTAFYYLLTYKAGWEKANESWKRNKWHIKHGGKEQVFGRDQN